tara:strand:+ start:1597 stop:2256 length:660 start_codon:yes stop_codon:yes gene_type:complete
MAYIGFAPVGKPLTSNDLVDGIVTEAKLGSLAVTAGKIGAGAIIEAKIGSDAVTLTKIANASVTAPKIANANVLTSEIKLDAIRSTLIAPLENLQEDASITGTALDDPTNIDLLNNSVVYCTAAADTNFAVNFRGDGSTALNSIMTTGNSISAAVMVTSTGSAYYINAVKVDGSAITPKVQGGSAIDAGNANSIDVYLFTIIKTGDAAFTILESQTQFA